MFKLLRCGAPADRDIFVQPCTQAYNTELHCKTGKTPAGLGLSCLVPRSTKFLTPTALQTETRTGTQLTALRLRPLSGIAGMWHNANNRTKAAQQRYNNILKPTSRMKHTSVSVCRSMQTAHLCSHRRRPKWPWNHVQNGSYAPLELISLHQRYLTPVPLTSTEFGTLIQ